MKKGLMKYKLVIAIVLGLFIGGCSNWLEVDPKSTEGADKLFQTEDGFKAALAGVYTVLSKDNLYGRELSFGLVSALGQEIGGGQVTNASGKYFNAASYNYEHVATKLMIDTIWTNMYYAVANTNTLIEYLENTGVAFSGNNHDIILGEAYALRAYVHFDLLRMFGKYDFSAGAAGSIPYVTEARPQIVKQYTPAEVVDLALKDLEKAKNLLANDPILTGNFDESDDYLLNRQFHMNYYAVVGLMARIHLYAGQTDLALQEAETIIEIQEETFPWVKQSDVTTTILNLRDRLFSSEHLFSLNVRKMVDYVKGYMREASSPILSRVALATLFEGINEYRSVFFENDNGVSEVPSKYWQMEAIYSNGDLVYPKRDRVPMLRVSEMYYIAAECYRLKNQNDLAVKRLNAVRTHRGIANELSENLDAGQILVEIEKEYQKEFFIEGQLFYYYKRRGDEKINNKIVNYKLPMPDDEIEFGQRN